MSATSQNASATLDEETTVRQPLLQPPLLLDEDRLDYPAAYRIVVEREGLRPQARVDVVQGRIVLKVLVRADGTVGAVETFASSGRPALDEAAARAAWGWTFAPATRDGVPIAAWAMIPVRFGP